MHTTLLSSYIKLNRYFILENVDIQEKIHGNKNVPTLKNGDLVYITTFIDVHKIFVRKVDDETEEFSNFIERVNLYCSAGIYYILIIWIYQ